MTYYDYKKCLFPIHRALAHFFDEKFHKFSEEYFEVAKRFVNRATIKTEDKNKIIDIMHKLTKSENFAKDCIKYYSGENLCYLFNKEMRDMEKFYLEMCYFIGPFYYGIFTYANENPEKQLKKRTILYRDLDMDRLDLYSYEFCENDIICFPSFTSTTLKKDLNFQPTQNAKKINNQQADKKHYVKMIITYDPIGTCVPQCIDITDEAIHKKEKEVLLFPFTFLKIDKVEIKSGTKNDKHLIYMTIINKGDVLEYGLKERKGFKLIDNNTKIIIDHENDSTCVDNEKFYNFKFKYIKSELI